MAPNLHNVTIDNTNLTAIHYYPPLCNGTGWVELGSPLAHDQTYVYCHSKYNAHAAFKFVGVSVYFQIPRFTTKESMLFSIDDSPFEQVDISSNTENAIPSAVVWSATDLPNAEHTVQIYPGIYNGSYGFVNVDAFIYTESDAPLESLNGVVESKTSDKGPIAIAVGVSLGIVILAILGIWAFFHFRKSRGRGKATTPTDYPSDQPFLSQNTASSTIQSHPTTMFNPYAGNNQAPSFSPPPPLLGIPQSASVTTFPQAQPTQPDQGGRQVIYV